MRPLLLGFLLCAACATGTVDIPPDSGTPDAGGQDAGGSDGGAPDAGASDAGIEDAGAPGGDGGCAVLPAPSGAVVRVTPAQANQLPAIVAGAASGTTILLADGTYTMTSSGESARRITFRTPGVTLRGESGDAAAVVLDGEYQTLEMLFIVASDVTVAHLTVKRAVDHPIHISTEGVTITGVRIYGVRLEDGGEQFIKINPNGARTGFVDDGRVECSTFTMTATGRQNVERTPGGCYTGGIDAHSARGWVVRLNRFEGIYCDGQGLAEHAVHFWVGGRDTLVENNTIHNCARGVGFGLGATGNGNGRVYPDDPYPDAGYIGHTDGLIRNNVITADVDWFDTGIELEQARGARVFHNTVVPVAGATRFFTSLAPRWANTRVELRNNLVRGLSSRNGAVASSSSNVLDVDATFFTNATGRDFHLAPGATRAIDRGEVVAGAGLDLDGEPHSKGAAPDIGADER